MSKTQIPKFINNPETCAEDYYLGFSRIFPQLIVNIPRKTVLLDKHPSKKVGLLSGGGSGHEPFVAGFVAQGMLAASVAGSVFASPAASPIYNGIKAVAKNHLNGVIVIIPNYTGDVLNFGLAVEKAKNEQIRVESIVVNDDCALIPPGKEADKQARVMARGLGGLVILYKIAGAMAEAGASLEQIMLTSKAVVENVGSMGVCVRASSLPGHPLLFELKENDVEIGVGIHGEAGFARQKFTTLSDLVDTMMSRILKCRSVVSKDKVIVMVNNLGGMSKLEEYILADVISKQLECFGAKLLRIYSGHVQTSIEMQGFAITILKIKDKAWIDALDAPTDSICWPGSLYTIPKNGSNLVTKESETLKIYPIDVKIIDENAANLLRDCLYAAAKAILENESKLNELDGIVGDGDCGSTLRRLAEEVLKSKRFTFQNPVNVFIELADISSDIMGGTSGAIYSLLFSGMASKCNRDDPSPMSFKIWAEILEAGVQLILKYSKAREGDRTMLDVVIPTMRTLSQNINKDKDLHKILEAVDQTANEACAATKHLEAKAGRAAYVNKEMFTDVDAGAHAVKVIINAITNLLQQKLP